MKLMHCPFCGGQGVIRAFGASPAFPYQTCVACTTCEAKGPWAKGETEYHATQQAVRQWNGRLSLDNDTVLRVAFKLTP